jgi:hypothetical protein
MVSAGRISHVIALYSKGKILYGVATNDIVKEGCDKITGYGYYAGTFMSLACTSRFRPATLPVAKSDFLRKSSMLQGRRKFGCD